MDKKMKIQNEPYFTGLSPLSQGLYTLNNNDMLNAACVDIFAMDTPRTIVEFKNRGREAGTEMGFREFTGTFIAEFSAVLFAKLASFVGAKKYMPETKVNSSSWITNKGLDVFNEIYKKSDKTPSGFAEGVLNSMQGLAGSEKRALDKDKVQEIKEGLTNLITEKGTKKAGDIQDEIVNALGADKNIYLKSGNKEFEANLSHVVRDTVDAGKNIFFKKGANPDDVVKKLKFINNSRAAFAIPAALCLALTNQYINRRLTKKRTGIDNFVGENNYENNVKTQNEQKNEKGLLAKKLLSAGAFLFMLTKTMGVKKPLDIVSKLEFNGPATGGNAIKTVYGGLILGRIFASKDSTELRETDTRDYLGFLNWLVLGGFVSKGVANALDPKRETLLNTAREGKGVKHWLSDISLKSQKEIIAAGGNVKKNLRNLNLAQIAGIGYSALMLGVLLPKLNIAITKKSIKSKEKENNKENTGIISFKEFKDSLNPHAIIKQ
ncbi:MAG: hypothetical protein LUE64_05800 [Candidatus Gastranaerophilales bacterium]|nr:hypothetical protein [Candidatus Gastranaerophilales bacterium]